MARTAVIALVIALALCLVHPVMGQFDQEFVDRHNYWRLRVNPPAGTCAHPCKAHASPTLTLSDPFPCAD